MFSTFFVLSKTRGRTITRPGNCLWKYTRCNGQCQLIMPFNKICSPSLLIQQGLLFKLFIHDLYPPTLWHNSSYLIPSQVSNCLYASCALLFLSVHPPSHSLCSDSCSTKIYLVLDMYLSTRLNYVTTSSKETSYHKFPLQIHVNFCSLLEI